MPAIRQLDPTLVNKIAAGEVIERPASVVKELIENAIDAGATRIDVSLEQGGVQLIRVADNGSGMGREDLPLAVAAHATSKIATSDDLFHISTLGFRGEALASIGSVSHLRICTRPNHQLEAYELTMSAEAGPTIKPAAASIGTTVEVRNLFYNVPARRKFLRQAPTEFGYVTEQIARLALAHPKIAFTLAHHDRTTRDLPPTENRRTRIADFYGAELAECLLSLDRDERGLRIEALLAPPAQSKASSKWQYVFLNGRYITDRRITYAIREAFRGLVEHDRYPVVFIFLTADPAEFDVNVHPTKIEVRWRDSGLVQSQVLAALRETLLSHDLTPRLQTPGGNAFAAGEVDPNHQLQARQALANYLKNIDPTQARIRFSPPPFPTQRIRPSIASSFHELRRDPFEALGNSLPEVAVNERSSTSLPRPGSLPEGEGIRQDAPIGAEGHATTDTEADSSRDEFSSVGATGPAIDLDRLAELGARSVMQIHNAYLVAQTDEGIIIIDQHALHERILYERFRERVLQGSLESQRLLLPETLNVSPAQSEAAEQHRETLTRIGVELSVFGPSALAVQSFPTLLHNVDIKTFVSDLLDKLAEAGGGASEETLIHAALDMMACKAAVKAGDPLTMEEMHALLEQRHLTQKSSNCPHGRPTSLELSTKDLEKQFKRI